MSTAYISATELKHKISEILNSVHFKKRVTIIERHGKPLAKIVPIENEVLKLTQKSKMDPVAASKRYFGILPDFPNVKKFRYFRRSPSL